MSKVSLRDVRAHDVDWLINWCMNPMVADYIGRPFNSRDGGLRWFDAVSRDPRAIVRIIEFGGRPIGSLQLLDISWRNKTGELRVFIGEPRLWGKGLGTTAIKLFLAQLVNVWNFREVHLRVDPDNGRARRAYEKCGFRTEGIMYPGGHDKLGKLLLMTHDLTGLDSLHAS